MIYTICSGYLVAATTKRKKDALLLTWLQEEVWVEFDKLDILNKAKSILDLTSIPFIPRWSSPLCLTRRSWVFTRSSGTQLGWSLTRYAVINDDNNNDNDDNDLKTIMMTIILGVGAAGGPVRWQGGAGRDLYPLPPGSPPRPRHPWRGQEHLLTQVSRHKH